MHAEDLFKKVKSSLLDIYPEAEARQLAWMLLEDKYAIDKMAIIKQTPVGHLDLSSLDVYIKALQQYTPIQHIVEKVAFCGLDLKVDARALIPRPETEEMVLGIINELEGFGSGKFNFLDIGTGSGCMAVTIAKKFPNAVVYALDISHEALSLAKENAEKHQVDINWLQIDILNPIDENLLPKVHFLASNPPYITQSESHQMRENVLNWEPHKALFVEDKQPLLFYQAILAHKNQLLYPKAKVFFEINERFGNDMLVLLKRNQFNEVLIEKDFRGKDRVAIASYHPR